MNKERVEEKIESSIEFSAGFQARDIQAAIGISVEWVKMRQTAARQTSEK